MLVKELTSKGLESFLNEKGVFFIDFWASWCAPCKSFAKTFEEVANEQDSIQFLKVNIETEPELSEIFQIRSVPHLMVFKDGVVIFSESGAMLKSSLNELIEQSEKAEVSTS